MKTYQKIRDSLNTFDLLVCEHKDLFWRLVGHTACVVKDYDKNMLWVWQATTQYGGYKGTSLTPLMPWLEQYQGKVYVRRCCMAINKDEAIRVRAERKLNLYIQKHRGDPYPPLKTAKGLWYMIASALDICQATVNHPIGKAKHCAARIADTYQYCGLLVPNLIVDEIEPDNWRDYMPLHESIDKYLAQGVILMPEVRIK